MIGFDQHWSINDRGSPALHYEEIPNLYIKDVQGGIPESDLLGVTVACMVGISSIDKLIKRREIESSEVSLLF